MCIINCCKINLIVLLKDLDRRHKSTHIIKFYTLSMDIIF